MLTQQQAEERQQGIGGSDVAAIAGFSPWRTPLEVYREKTEPVEVEDDSNKPWLYWGSVFEADIANEYSKRTGYNLVDVRKSVAHPEFDFVRAMVDRNIESREKGRGVLECKSALFCSDEWGQPGTDEVPDYYHVQVDQEMLATGATWGELAVLFLTEREFFTYRFERDPEIDEWLISIERKFWTEHVLARKPPAPLTLADMVNRWPRDTGKRRIASGAGEEACAALGVVKQEIKGLEAKQEQLEKQIKLEMEDSATLIGLDGRPLATWKASDTSRIDVTRLRKEKPSVAESYTKTAPVRRFLLKV